MCSLKGLLRRRRSQRASSPKTTAQIGKAHPVQAFDKGHSSAADKDLHLQSKGPEETKSVLPVSGGISGHDLWDQAYESLRSQKPELIADYEKTLLLEESDGEEPSSRDFGATGTVAYEKRLRALAAKKLDALEKSQLKIQLGTHGINVMEQVDRAVKVVIAAKDFVGSTVAAEPHAALVWAGVCVVLPLLLNPTEQFQALQEGLGSVPLIVDRFRVYERVFCRTNLASPSGQSVKLLEDVSTVVDQLKNLMKELYVRILEYEAQAVCQLSHHAVYRYIRGVFKIDDWRNLLQEINELDRSCTSLMKVLDSHKLDSLSRKWDDLLHAFYNQNSDLKDFQQKMEQRMNKEAEERLFRQQTQLEIDCHQAFNDPSYINNKEVNPLRIPGTCQWFLTHQKFTDWRDNQSSPLLWVSADPGCGKSVLCRSLIDEELLSSNSATVCYYFFKNNANQRSATKALSALLHQLFSRKPHLIKYALDGYRQFKDHISEIFSVMWSILTKAAADADAGKVICVLDALDECEQQNVGSPTPGRNRLIEGLVQLCSQARDSKITLKFLVTSRPYFDIERAFQRGISNLDQIRLKGEDQTDAMSREIGLVIEAVVASIANELRLQDNVKKDLLRRFQLTENRTYLWLHLMFDVIRKSLGCTESPDLLKLVETLPKNVIDYYEAILRNVDSKHHDRALRLLQIVVVAERPLSVKEVRVILAVQEDMKSCDELSLESEEAFKITVRNICGLFVRILDSKVYLIHDTAREFLTSKQRLTDRQDSVWRPCFSATDANRVFARICMTYLLFSDYSAENQLGQSLLDWTWNKSHFPGRDRGQDEFLDHAALHWTRYAYQGEYDGDVKTLNMALRLFKEEGHFEFWTKFFRHHEKARKVSYGIPYKPLLLASYTGLRAIAAQLTDSSTVNETEFYGCSALYWAVYQGHLEVAEDLLNAHADTEIEGIKGMPLHAAVEKDNLPMVELLLQCKHPADVNAVTHYEYIHPEATNDSPLHRAASSKIAELLLKSGANIESLDMFGKTPLMAIACYDDRVDALEVLLSHHSNVNAKDRNGQTALSHAVWSTRKDVLEKLLRSEADPNLASNDLKTPLHKALEYERAYADTHGIVECLLQAGADVTARTSSGKTPLQIAVEAVQPLHVIQLLLDKGANINAEIAQGGVLHLLIPIDHGTDDYIARKKQLMSFLLDRHANKELKDSEDGRTPLLKAVYEGDIVGVKLLLEHGASVEATDKHHQNAIDIALAGRHSEIVLLIAKSKRKRKTSKC